MSEHVFDVIVVGGGFAGVSAFRDLRVAGRDAVLLEARDRLGGRTWYRPFAGTDQHVEFGGTWTVDRHQHNIAAEKERYGLATAHSPKPKHWQMNLAGSVRDSALPVEFDDIADLERAVFLLMRDARRIKLGEPFDGQNLDDLDIAFGDWMDAHEIDGGVRAYLSAFVGLNFGSAPDEVSALHLLIWIAGMGYSPWTMAAALDEKFADGTKSLIDAMVAEADGEVRLSTPVARIEQDAEDVRVHTRAGESFRARSAIVATPLNTWKDIEFSPELSEPKTKAAATGHAGHSVKPWALVKGAPELFASWAWDGGMCWLSTEFELEEGDLTVGFAHSPEVLDVNDTADVAAKVKAFLPDDVIVLRHDAHNWVGDEFSQGTWMSARPGQLTRLHSGLMASEGRLAFAGADLALIWPGWIEGAIQSGRAVAASLVND